MSYLSCFLPYNQSDRNSSDMWCMYCILCTSTLSSLIGNFNEFLYLQISSAEGSLSSYVESHLDWTSQHCGSCKWLHMAEHFHNIHVLSHLHIIELKFRPRFWRDFLIWKRDHFIYTCINSNTNSIQKLQLKFFLKSNHFRI